MVRGEMLERSKTSLGESGCGAGHTGSGVGQCVVPVCVCGGGWFRARWWWGGASQP